MKQLRTLASAVLVCLFGVAGTGAQTPAVRTPTVDEILDRYVAAVGGQAALEKLTSYAMQGTIQFEDVLVIGKVEMYGKAPNKTASTYHMPNLGVSRLGFDGTVAWSREFGKDARELEGEELDSARLDSDFYGHLHYGQNYPQMKLLGKDRVGTHEAYVIEAKPARGSLRKFYFDAETRLLLRRDVVVVRGERRELVQAYSDDYRDVDGRKFPFRLRVVSPRLTSLLRVTSIQLNVPIEDTVFAMPKTP